MNYYNSNSYFYPRTRNGNLKINHIVDFTPDEYKSTYQYRTIDGRPSDAFYFKPTHGNSTEKKYKKYGNLDIHTRYNEPLTFNENGIIREKNNYILYENKNWTENVQYPIVEYEKIELPPPPKPKPKPKPEPVKFEPQLYQGSRVDDYEIKKLKKGHFVLVVTANGQRMEVPKRFKSTTKAKEWISKYI